MKKGELFYFLLGMLPIFMFVGLSILIMTVQGCAHNPCIDNPRNMQCMTPEEIEEALDV